MAPTVVTPVNNFIAASILAALVVSSAALTVIAYRRADALTGEAGRLSYRVRRSVFGSAATEMTGVREYTPLTRIEKPFSQVRGKGGIARPLYQEELVA